VADGVAAAPVAIDREDDNVEDEREGGYNSAASGSGSGSEEDEAALEGFAGDEVQWQRVYDSVTRSHGDSLSFCFPFRSPGQTDGRWTQS
jgi:hypothetical protein